MYLPILSTPVVVYKSGILGTQSPRLDFICNTVLVNWSPTRWNFSPSTFHLRPSLRRLCVLKRCHSSSEVLELPFCNSYLEPRTRTLSATFPIGNTFPSQESVPTMMQQSVTNGSKPIPRYLWAWLIISEVSGWVLCPSCYDWGLGLSRPSTYWLWLQYKVCRASSVMDSSISQRQVSHVW